MSKVRVVACDSNGNIIKVSRNNPEYGSIRVESSHIEFTTGGWLRHVRRTAFINGKVEDLKNADLSADQELTGKIIVQESLTPFYEENPDIHLKVAGESGIVCRLDDQPIYRRSVFTPDVTAKDELIQHTNREEISSAIRAGRELSKVAAQMSSRNLITSEELDDIL